MSPLPSEESLARLIKLRWIVYETGGHRWHVQCIRGTESFCVEGCNRIETLALAYEQAKAKHAIAVIRPTRGAVSATHKIRRGSPVAFRAWSAPFAPFPNSWQSRTLFAALQKLHGRRCICWRMEEILSHYSSSLWWTD